MLWSKLGKAFYKEIFSGVNIVSLFNIHTFELSDGRFNPGSEVCWPKLRLL